MPFEAPLISAIMPTRGRPSFARNALACFLAQTWPNKELVIVDDSLDTSFPDSPAREGIRYLSIGHWLTIGAKRNRACAEAEGEIICHWDDDDWSSPARMADQVERLISSGADLTGYTDMEFRDGSSRWFYGGFDDYVLGTSLMFWRRAWRERPFETINSGEDLLFQAGRRIAAVPSRGLMLGTIHSGNTCPRSLSRPPWRKLTEAACCA